MDNVSEQIGGTMNSMALAVFILLGMYMLAPMLIAAVLLRVCRVRGQAFKFLIGIVGLVGLYFMMTNGIQDLPSKIQ
ncbi:hypothetical protein J2T13_003650 [Paenibacillus sp. DS2015]|uniref:hypothetical protein n=1 Tax=Paenibacillus sp. DS2015 TaxID=3373917 RepID=UPI003D19F5DE